MDMQQWIGKVWRLRRELTDAQTGAHPDMARNDRLRRELVQAEHAVATAASVDEQADDSHLGYLG